jgi:outer membrane protein TolC
MRVVTLGLVLGSLLAGPARAEQPDVAALVAEAWASSPSLSALKARLAGTRERVSPAGALANPVLGVMYQSAGAPWSPMRQGTMWQVEASQGLPWPGKRAARREEAAAEAGVRQGEILQLQQALAREVRMSFAGVYALDREREVLEAGREVLDLMSATVGARYATGQAEQEALIKVQLESSRLNERLADLQAERDGLRAELNRLLDRPSDGALDIVTSLPEVSLDLASMEDAALAYCCAVAMARAEVVAAEKRLASMRLETRPDFNVGLAAGTTLTPEPMITLRLGLDLPAWRDQKQDRLVAAARRDLEAAQSALKAEETRARAEIARLKARWERDQRQLTLYREGILPQTALAMDAARASYLAGRGDFSMLAEDFRLWLEARAGLARREAERFMTWAEVAELTTQAPGLGQ